jgi:hypothetical protein
MAVAEPTKRPAPITPAIEIIVRWRFFSPVDRSEPDSPVPVPGRAGASAPSAGGAAVGSVSVLIEVLRFVGPPTRRN